jgi:hypothetical protein
MRNTSMVQLFGTTYRISEVRSGFYEVVRILDEAVAGSFSLGHGPLLSVVPVAVDAALMRRLVAAAVQSGKTSWMGARAMINGGTDSNQKEQSSDDSER